MLATLGWGDGFENAGRWISVRLGSGEMSKAPSDLWSPPTHFDGFEIRGIIGQGGMGRVYLAFETMLGRFVAIKFMVGQELSRLARERFLLEA